MHGAEREDKDPETKAETLDTAPNPDLRHSLLWEGARQVHRRNSGSRDTHFIHSLTHSGSRSPPNTSQHLLTWTLEANGSLALAPNPIAGRAVPRGRPVFEQLRRT